MNAPKSYIKGFLKAAKMPRMLFLLYIANLFTALLLALPFMGALKSGFGQSKMVSGLVKDFNFTAVADMLYYNGHGILAILGGVKWLVLAYFILSVFLTGGIIGTYNKEKYTNSNFFGAGAYNFFRFLSLNIITIILQIGVALAVYLPLISILKSRADVMESELSYIPYIIGGFALHGLLFLIISMIGDYSKFYLVLDNSFNIFKGFWRGTKYVFGHFIKTFFLNILLLIIPAAAIYGYFYFQNDLKMATGLGILIVFLVQQAFVLARCFLRSWSLGSQYQMYAYDFAVTDPVQGVLLKVFDQSSTKEITNKPADKTNAETTTTTQNQPSNYAIDFNSTFSADNEVETDDKIVSEQEMIDKFNEGENNDFNYSNISPVENNANESPSIDLEAEESEEITSGISNPVINNESYTAEQNSIDNEAVVTENSIEVNSVTENVISENLDNEAEIDENESAFGEENTTLVSENVVDEESSNLLSGNNLNETIVDESLNNEAVNIVNPVNESVVTESEIEEKLSSALNEETQINVDVVDGSSVNEITDTEIEEKLIINNTDIQQETETSEEKIYTAGQTVDFDNESLIAQQMSEQINAETNPDQMTDAELEQKMIQNIDNEGTIIDNIQIPRNIDIHQNHKKDEVILEINTVAEEIIKEHNLQGVSEVGNNIDGEVIVEDLDNEAEIITISEMDNDIDESDGHTFEVIEQNVLEGLENAELRVGVGLKKRKNDEDIVEFEL